MRTKGIRILLMTVLCLAGFAITAFAQEEDIRVSEESAKVLALSAALCVGIGCVSAAYAVARVGSAAMGAAAERPDILGRAILFVALGEGIAIMGFGIAFLLWLKI